MYTDKPCKWSSVQIPLQPPKNILIDEKNYKDLIIYFTRCNRGKSIRILNLYYQELVGKIEEDKGKKYLMIDDNI